MSGQTLVRADIPLPGGGEAVYQANGFAYYRHGDGLGSAALSTDAAGTLDSSTRYSPYGADRTGAAAGYRGFTGEKQDIDSSHSGGQYDFLEREYNPVQGRWWTPDPAGLAAVDPNNPQTWNRYAYVVGTPLEATDPLGLFVPDDIGFGAVISCVDKFLPVVEEGQQVGENYADTQCSITSSLLDDDGSSSPGGDSGSGPTVPLPSGPQAPNNAPIGTPKTPAQCSVYQDGSKAGAGLNWLCSSFFPNGPKSNKMRGCLQSFYTPASGYVPIPVIISATPGSYVDLNGIIPGTGAHLVCLANALGLPYLFTALVRVAE